MIKKTTAQIFNEFIESIGQAEGAASQLIHHAGNPVGFVIIREALSLTKEACLKVAPQNALLKPKTIYV